jgi:EAL domain-containing protein (putative c-di-GMP-specific phosphodiesterase class I)
MPMLPLRVLVLGDDPVQRSIAVNLLWQSGCQDVFVAADGVQALAILEQVRGVSEPVALLANEEEVRRALVDQEMQTYFQPKFNLLSGEVRSIEALARWHHPSKGVLPPSAFMAVIERCGLMDELLFLQLEQGLSLQRLALDQGFPLNVAFNLQAAQVANADLVPRIKSMLSAHDLPGSGLTFGLAETGLLDAPATSFESLMRLRMMGCSLSTQGQGYSCARPMTAPGLLNWLDLQRLRASGYATTMD